MKTYLTLEKSISHKSNYDGSIYKFYVTSFFSYTKSHHTINDFYDEEGNVYIPEVYSFCEKKVDPDTNEMFVRKRQIGPILKERSLCEIIEPQGGRIFMPGTSKVDWMHMFAEQESSELSISQYCKLHGISDKAFYNARSRYKKTDETPSLVAVEVSDDTGSSNTGCISFKLNGMSFEFDESAPDSDIQRIIKICLSL